MGAFFFIRLRITNLVFFKLYPKLALSLFKHKYNRLTEIFLPHKQLIFNKSIPNYYHISALYDFSCPLAIEESIQVYKNIAAPKNSP